MSELSNVISELVAKGWPRDYAQVEPPCWFTFAKSSPAAEPLEDPDYAPDLEGRESILVIAPPTAYFLFVEVGPSGELGSTNIEVHDGQVHMGDGTAGEIPVWPGLEAALDQARLIYIQWEVQQLREEAHG
ncbi:hypothetical protein [Synechococcus sp. LA31]|uniref:hypothetical protein n=1 Tax=Synechococcus sp. LA31 TaxID=2741953 RepID=UPI001BDC123D|nr:hypothetical protein [Synechococcus sp. LA31]QVV66781.1 hypothetical protein KJJ24_09820 [Synechococcus sp. LA31]